MWTLFLGLAFFFACFFFVFLLGSTLMPLKEAEPVLGGPLLRWWRALPGAGPVADLPLAALASLFFSDLFTRMERPSSLLPSSFRASWTASELCQEEGVDL